VPCGLCRNGIGGGRAATRLVAQQPGEEKSKTQNPKPEMSKEENQEWIGSLNLVLRILN
jgi:hypothetical protein